MIYTIIAIRDRQLDAYGRPAHVATKGQAIRGFSDEINRADPNNEMNKHPEDFDLYYLGTFNDQTGITTNAPEGPEQISIGKNVKIN